MKANLEILTGAVAHPERVRASGEHRVGMMYRQEGFLTAQATRWKTMIGAATAAVFFPRCQESLPDSIRRVDCVGKGFPTPLKGSGGAEGKLAMMRGLLILFVTASIWSCGDDRLVDIRGIDLIPPATITDLEIGCVTIGSVELIWTAPGDDGMAGQAAAYDIRYHTALIDSITWKTATKCSLECVPRESGASESHVVTDLEQGTPYFFAIRAMDEASNRGGLSNSAHTQTHDIDIVTWAQNYGGPFQEGAGAIVYATSATDGGYVLGGETSSYGDNLSNFYFLKVDEYGNQVWHSWYGCSPLVNIPYGFTATLDGGYIMVGAEGDVNDFDADILVVKVDGSGNLIWEKTYGKSGYRFWDIGSAIAAVPNGGYIVGGETESVDPADGCLLRIAESGEVIWWKTYPGAGTPFCVYVTTDGGFLTAGLALSGGVFCGGLIRTDGSGNLIWNKVIGTALDCQILYSVVPTQKEGHIIVGYTHEPWDAYVSKVDASGNLIWERRYGGVANDRAYSVCRAHCGGYIVAGGTSSTGAGEEDIWLFKIDESGNLLWQRAYGGVLSEFAMSVVPTLDGGYIVGAKTVSYGNGGDFWILKVDGEGRLFE